MSAGNDGRQLRVAALKRSADLGGSMLAAIQRDDGSLGPPHPVVESYYKGILAFLATGRSLEAARLAAFVAGQIDAHGDVPSPREELDFLDTHYLYANGYLTIGCQLLGRFDLARSLFAFMRSRQDPVSGGFLSYGPNRATTGCCDTVSTGIGGLAALHVGALDVAERAADFLRHLWAVQPDRPRTFVASACTGGALDSAGSVVRLAITEPDQDWYFVGLPALFLAALSRRTGNSQHEDLAVEFVELLVERAHDEAMTDPSAGKLAVAAAMLTGRGGQRYVDVALGICEVFVARQSPDGWWNDGHVSSADRLTWSDLDMTAEYVVWLDLVARNIVVEPSAVCDQA